jgi:hypothetical protein
MGLSAPSLKYILSITKKYHLRGPLLTYGNQDIYANQKNLENWLEKYHFHSPKTIKIYNSTSQDLIQINKEAGQFIHAKTFFSQIGIKEKDYYDVDKFDFDKPKILHDLSKPFPKKYHGFFNFVIDSGTIEHIFDIKSVMENTAKLTKVGGIVLHLIPANNYLNHGFYQISPTFFYDFYTANGFKVLESYLTETRPTRIRFHQYRQTTYNNKFFINPYSRLGSLFLVKKIKNIDRVISPTQFFYSKISTQPKKNIKHFDFFTNFFRKLLPFKYHSLFYIPWVFFNQIFAKRDYFDIDFD